MTILASLTQKVSEAFAVAGHEARFGEVRVSDRPDLAQFQCNGALAAAKAAGTSPRAVAESVAGVLRTDPTFASVTLAGPGFINLTLADAHLEAMVAALAADAGLGAWRAAEPETIVIDYGGPNVAKPLHVGHLRSAIIGESLKRILRAAGHRVVGDIHLGDWGLQMGQLISELEIRRPELAYFAPEATGPFPEAPPISLVDLETMYPAASAACKADPARADLARKATKALQDGRPGYRALWRHFVDLSVAALRADYEALGVTFDLWKGEADADPLIPELVADLEGRALAERSDGALIVRVARGTDRKEVPPIMLVNSEGAVGYHATDLATIVDRRRSIAPDRMLYVVDNRQALHFEQVFRAADLAGYFAEDRLEHLPFGTMNGADGRPFKTREGGVLRLRDLIDQTRAAAAARIAESRSEREGAQAPDEAETASIVERVAVATIKFADLSNPRVSDYIFDLDRFSSFEGKTGPYLLYASVRARSILTRAGMNSGEPPAGEFRIEAAEDRDLALALVLYGEATRQAANRRLPHLVAEHAFVLAQKFSTFYAARRVLDEADLRLRASRLALASVTARQLDHALSLLGIDVPERM